MLWSLAIRIPYSIRAFPNLSEASPPKSFPVESILKDKTTINNPIKTIPNK